MAGEKTPGVELVIDGARFSVDALRAMLAGDGCVVMIPPRAKWLDGAVPTVVRVGTVSGDNLKFNTALMKECLGVANVTV